MILNNSGVRTARWLHAGMALLLTACLWTGAAGPATAQTSDTIEGRLMVMWGDPRPGQLNGAMHFEIVQADGTIVPVDIPPAQRNAAVGAFNKQVILRGQRNARQAFSTTAIELVEPSPPVQPQVLPLAKKRVLNIAVKFSGDTQTPHAPSFFQALVSPMTPNPGLGIPATVNDFFRKTSWNQLRWISHTVGVGGINNPTLWLTLPKTKTQYANCGWSGSCAAGNLGTLFTDAMTLAAAQGVNVAIYDNVNIMLNNDLDCCAWGGGGTFNSKSYGVTWNPPWSQNTGVLVHEMGHSLGLPHSGWVYHAYDSNWDQMSNGTAAQNVFCGTYNSANNGGTASNLYCDEPGSGYIAAYKDYMGWIPDANKVVVNSISNQVVRLTPNGTGLGTTAIKMVKICLSGFPCTGMKARYITVEARVRTGTYENALPNEGVLIHDFRRNRLPIGGACFFNSQSGYAVPIDSSPGDYSGSPTCGAGGLVYPNWGLHNAHYSPGQSYTNGALGVRVVVIQRNSNNFIVRVIRTK